MTLPRLILLCLLGPVLAVLIVAVAMSDAAQERQHRAMTKRVGAWRRQGRLELYRERMALVEAGQNWRNQ